MAQVDANWVIPSANPINAPPGVSAVSAGAGITITGTSQNPVISSVTGTGAVQSVEGLVGAIDLFGSGLGIGVSGQTITLTSAVSTLVAGSNCSILESPPGTFTIANTIQAGGTFQRFQPGDIIAASPVSVNGGGGALNCGAVTPLPTVTSANSYVLFTLYMSGLGTLNQGFLLPNKLQVGIFQQGNPNLVCGYDSGTITPLNNLNWGTAIPSSSNFLVTANVPLVDFQNGNYYFGFFVNFPYNSSPYYTFNNLGGRLIFTYLG